MVYERKLKKLKKKKKKSSFDIEKKEKRAFTDLVWVIVWNHKFITKF